MPMQRHPESVTLEGEGSWDRDRIIPNDTPKAQSKRYIATIHAARTLIQLWMPKINIPDKPDGKFKS